MKATSQALQARGIVEPTLVLDEAQAVRNIERMVAKARAAGVALRPHFKTHQSAAVGELFRARGVRAITVSSLPMASYFAAHGWDDIGVAIPVNVRALATINELAQRVRLTLLVESVAAVAALAAGLAQEVALWLEIDPGYGRSGVAYDAPAEALAVAQAIVAAPHCRFAGLLAHAGQSYAARTPAGIAAVHTQSLARLRQVQAYLQAHGIAPCPISVGDTPTCSVMDDFPGVDELRPGNFVFYDLMQVQIGACTSEEIAVAVACPIIARYPQRGQVVVHGGAVHFSKEALVVEPGRVVYGYPTTMRDGRFGPALTQAPLVALSQEHGILNMPLELLEPLALGDLLLIFPVHSCLTVNLMRR